MGTVGNLSVDVKGLNEISIQKVISTMCESVLGVFAEFNNLVNLLLLISFFTDGKKIHVSTK